MSAIMDVSPKVFCDLASVGGKMQGGPGLTERPLHITMGVGTSRRV